MLQGDLTKFSAGDLLSFLAHMNQEGVLTVTQDGQVLNLCVRDGRIIGADSERADLKSLSVLFVRGFLDAKRYETLVQARRETGLPLLELLRASDNAEPEGVAEAFELGLGEVVFQLFSWERGRFQFNEVGVANESPAPSIDCTAASMDAARQVDEVREFLRGAANAERVLCLTDVERDEVAQGPQMRLMLEAAAAGRTVREALDEAPISSHQAMKALKTGIASGWIRLSDPAAGEATAASASAEQAFLNYKRSLGKLRNLTRKREQVSELLAFCRDTFETFLLIALREDRVVRCRRFRPGVVGQEQGVELPGVQAHIQDDPTFRFVRDQGAPFFGKVFDSDLLRRLDEHPSGGDCALIPLGSASGEDYLLYVHADEGEVTPGPLHYLELVVAQVVPPGEGAPVSRPVAQSAPKPPVASSVAARSVTDPATAAAMVAAVDELPPMPHVVTRILDLLADPDSQVSQMVEVLSRDPALVARLIRVSNSALYGRGQETTSLDQAVVRLGGNTVRSLVLAASMRSLFPLEKTKVGLWGQSLWQHSIECGLAARRVAQESRAADPEEAFVAGVLHDIGKVVVLLNQPEQYGRILRERGAAPHDSVVVERSILGFDHTEVGQLLLEKWQLPKDLQLVVRHHHAPPTDSAADDLVRIVAVGNLLSHRCGSQPDAEGFADLEEIERLCAELRIPLEGSERLLAETGAVLENSGLLD